MKTLKRTACLTTILLLGACASPPLPRHVTLDDGRPRMARSLSTPSVVISRTNVPDLVDRPQLVLRSNGNQVTLSDQYRWAEPLRREIPRVIASDLGELLDSSAVVALSSGVEGVIVDFKLMLDFQQLDAVVGQGVDIDALWRLEHVSGNLSIGRSSFRQPLAGAADDESALVTAQRQALRRVADDIAKEIAVFQKCQLAAAKGNHRAELNMAICTAVNSKTFR